jgi:catechol 2,3-dioxygenase-like lactoylglutathione lyase family enzyme
MIHHVSLGTNDAGRAKAFYGPLMSLIGFRLLKHSERALHYGASDIVLSLETPIDGLPATSGNGVHVAFQAPDRETVRNQRRRARALPMPCRACVFGGNHEPRARRKSETSLR